MESYRSPVNVAAVVLAAGSSKRMGEPKLVLPWGKTTVIGQVVSTLAQAGVVETVVVTGGAHQVVLHALDKYAVRTVYNPCYEHDEMIYSLQVGLSVVSKSMNAAMVVLGDQPKIQTEIVSELLDICRALAAEIIVPSFRMRRGHPWIVARSLWTPLMEMRSPATLRDFLENYKHKIHYVNVGSDTVLLDMDTPSDYREQRP